MDTRGQKEEGAEKACRCSWCIAEVGQNPLNYSFLAALRRPSLKCRHKPRWAHRRGPPATCVGIARFRCVFFPRPNPESRGGSTVRPISRPVAVAGAAAPEFSVAVNLSGPASSAGPVRPRFAPAINQDEVPAVKPILKSNKLLNVCYDIRGPVLEHAKRLEEEGHRIIKLNIGNLAPFGFEIGRASCRERVLMPV